MDDATRFWSKVDRQADDCWPWSARRNQYGYGHFQFRQRTWKAHRVAWTLANGEIPSGLNVLHRCDNPPCCNPEHLFLGTQSDNVADMDAKSRRRAVAGPGWAGVRQPGESNPRAKLTAEAVAAIRRERASGVGPNELAARYGISRSQVHNIVTGRRWASA